MGMYDYVKCEHKLSGSPCVAIWQTKDTPEQGLESYTITREGKLIFHEEVVDISGEVCFYGHDKPGRWWEFVALFSHGELVEIKRVVP